jgi:hypothetical protein
VADASGVRSVPPAVVGPWVKGLAVAGVLLTVAGLALASKKKKKKKTYRAPYRDHPARSRRTGGIGHPPAPAQPGGPHSPAA